jgi:hypothetical protein
MGRGSKLTAVNRVVSETLALSPCLQPVLPVPIIAMTVQDGMYDYRINASRVNGTVSVAAIPWRFTYLCWNIPTYRTLRRINVSQRLDCVREAARGIRR